MENVWPDRATYFLTGSTFLHYPYFKLEQQKQVFLNQMQKAEERYGIKISDYSIAINHYHLKFNLDKSAKLAGIKQLLHGGTTYNYKKLFPMKYKEFWQSFRSLIVETNETDMKVTGYIIGNLLKHKEVNTFDELKDNPFSSFKIFTEKNGEEFARQLVYQVIDINENNEGEINLKDFKNIQIIGRS